MKRFTIDLDRDGKMIHSPKKKKKESKISSLRYLLLPKQSKEHGIPLV